MAPEYGLAKNLRARHLKQYITADLNRRDVDIQVDLTNLPFDGESFDLVVCSDVLEHIENDRAAISNIYRVLSPEGVAVIRVPIRGDTTLEDSSVTSAEERDRLFGQPDHVRRYGRDICVRLEEAGFGVEEVALPESLGLSTQDSERFGLGKQGWVYLCRKP